MVFSPNENWKNFEELNELYNAYLLLHELHQGKGSFGNFDSAAKLVNGALQAQAERFAKLYKDYGLLMHSPWANLHGTKNYPAVIQKLNKIASNFEDRLRKIVKGIESCKQACEDINGSKLRAANVGLMVLKTAFELSDVLNAAHHLLLSESSFQTALNVPVQEVVEARKQAAKGEKAEANILHLIRDADSHLREIAGSKNSAEAYGHFQAASTKTTESLKRLAAFEADLSQSVKKLAKSPPMEKELLQRMIREAGSLENLLKGICSDLEKIKKARTFTGFASSAEGLAAGKLQKAAALATAILEDLECIKNSQSETGRFLV